MGSPAWAHLSLAQARKRALTNLVHARQRARTRVGAGNICANVPRKAQISFRLDLCWPVCLAGENIPAQPPKNLSLRVTNPSKCSPIELPFRVQAQSTSTRHVCKPSHPCIRTHALRHTHTYPCLICNAGFRNSIMRKRLFEL